MTSQTRSKTWVTGTPSLLLCSLFFCKLHHPERVEKRTTHYKTNHAAYSALAASPDPHNAQAGVLPDLFHMGCTAGALSLYLSRVSTQHVSPLVVKLLLHPHILGSPAPQLLPCQLYALSIMCIWLCSSTSAGPQQGLRHLCLEMGVQKCKASASLFWDLPWFQLLGYLPRGKPLI